MGGSVDEAEGYGTCPLVEGDVYSLAVSVEPEVGVAEQLGVALPEGERRRGRAGGHHLLFRRRRAPSPRGRGHEEDDNHDEAARHCCSTPLLPLCSSLHFTPLRSGLLYMVLCKLALVCSPMDW